MGFLTILNYIAMGIGYAILLFTLFVIIYLFWYIIKEQIEKKKAEKMADKIDKEDVQKISENKQATQSTAENNKEPNDNKENLVDENSRLKMVS